MDFFTQKELELILIQAGKDQLNLSSKAGRDLLIEQINKVLEKNSNSKNVISK